MLWDQCNLCLCDFEVVSIIDGIWDCLISWHHLHPYCIAKFVALSAWMRGLDLQQSLEMGQVIILCPDNCKSCNFACPLSCPALACYASDMTSIFVLRSRSAKALKSQFQDTFFGVMLKRFRMQQSTISHSPKVIKRTAKVTLIASTQIGYSVSWLVHLRAFFKGFPSRS